jgi:hypothetical protein
MGRPRTQDLGCLDRSRTSNPRRTTHVEVRFLAWLCTAVDRRWKKALEVPLSAIFPDVSLNCQVPELDQQVVLCEVDQTGNGGLWPLNLRRGIGAPQSGTPTPAICTLSQVIQNGTRPALAGVTGPHPPSEPLVACPRVDLTVTRGSSFLNDAGLASLENTCSDHVDRAPYRSKPALCQVG